MCKERIPLAKMTDFYANQSSDIVRTVLDAEIRLVHITEDMDFWGLMEVFDDIDFAEYKYKMIHDFERSSIKLDTNIYGLEVNRTYIDNYDKDLFGTIRSNLLPCFCIKTPDNPLYSCYGIDKFAHTAQFIWTHPKARKNGFAKKLVDLLEIKDALNPTANSIDFWEKCNVQLKYT